MVLGRFLLGLLLLCGLATACAKNQSGKAAAVAENPSAIAADTARSSAASAAVGGALSGVTTPSLRVSDEIARACGLSQNGPAPKFGFDSSAIGPEDTELLAALARCLSDGPLRGRRLTLVGRADARGEDEYNMTLGGARADSVKRYLGGLGVESSRLLATSRGELDAAGSDELTWALDRRVDIELLAN